MNFEVLYSAAHAEFPDTEPLGGGKAVADYLIREWESSAPFALSVLSPRAVGLVGNSPRKTLAELSELEYARFCRQLERASTTEILKHDPQKCIVLSNDISEGPDFVALAEQGYRIVTIFHVDVVEYFTKFYLRGLLRPETAARFRWFGVLPDVLRLVFQKQSECVRHSRRIVVPSVPMRDTILRCYPWCAAEKIVVLPWGNIGACLPFANMDRQDAYPTITDDEFVILTLSRLSPEKGIERLLKAIARLGTLNSRVRVVICGGAAYMKGAAYERKLRRLAAQIKNARIDFTGHVSGAQKTALLRRADLFVSPSQHESYGLTIVEAQAAGCRVISHFHYGASGMVVDCSDPVALSAALSAIVATGRTQKATTIDSSRSHAAEQLAELLVLTHSSSQQPVASLRACIDY